MYDILREISRSLPMGNLGQYDRQANLFISHASFIRQVHPLNRLESFQHILDLSREFNILFTLILKELTPLTWSARSTWIYLGSFKDDIVDFGLINRLHACLCRRRPRKPFGQRLHPMAV